MNQVGIDTLWALVAGFLVFFMQAGFAMVEAGFVRAKNAVNIIMKNLLDFSIATICFFAVGYGLMFGDGNGFMGIHGLWFLNGADNSPAIGDAYRGVYSALNWAGIPLFAKFFFELVFAGTAATIVSGAVAERIKFSSYLIYTFIISAVVYPIVGHWIWGGGFLAGMGVFDFAGSTVVHAVGGAAGLAGAIILGPRIGKYNKDRSANVIAGHNIPLAALGVFILWFGWFGFNPGSTLSVGDGVAISLISANTNIAAAVAGLSALIVTWIKFKKPDASMAMNGVLAGLVAITAPCAFVTPLSSAMIGLVAGVLVVFSVVFFDSINIDDPVGAVSVHMVNGIWGTISVGLFGLKSLGLSHDGLFNGGGFHQLMVQTIGTLSGVAFSFFFMLIVFKVIAATVGLRVDRHEELKGLDVGEHGMEAYSEFQIFTSK
ncbi:MAG: ammonium transporter [Candidatus Aureabacteria bacterium]|nr:ammonium transporter [Candidatus Auribacterota bacterium]